MKMVLWGGLKPIRSRFLLDIITLTFLFYCSIIRIPTAFHNSILILSILLTLYTAGLTRRWTISLPLIPYSIFHLIRFYYHDYSSKSNWNRESTTNSTIMSNIAALIPHLLQFLCIVSVIISLMLTILFPALELSQVTTGKYAVGVIDLHLPIIDDDDDNVKTKNDNNSANIHTISCRILYPTNPHPHNHHHTQQSTTRTKGFNPSPKTTPYLNPSIANLICKAFMSVGAPKPLNRLSFILHTWQLTHVPLHRNAPLFSDDDAKPTKFPCVIYSHGLTGNATIYTYQAMNLASHGMIVLLIEHTDGSSIGVLRQDGSFLSYQHNITSSSSSSTTSTKRDPAIEYVRSRRDQTNHRCMEFKLATKALLALNSPNHNNNIQSIVQQYNISFSNRIDTNHIIAMGHSFGGATALSAVSRYPNLYSSVIVHDPACDWMPDDCRQALFDHERLVGSKFVYLGGTGGYDNPTPKQPKQANSTLALHSKSMQFLYSEEWSIKNWGGFNLIQCMFHRSQLGPLSSTSSSPSSNIFPEDTNCLLSNSSSNITTGNTTNNKVDFGIIPRSHHSEFSDSCMMTPLWLARATGMTGKMSNPHESATEIHVRTLEFLYDACILDKKRKEK